MTLLDKNCLFNQTIQSHKMKKLYLHNKINRYIMISLYNNTIIYIQSTIYIHTINSNIKTSVALYINNACVIKN